MKQKQQEDKGSPFWWDPSDPKGCNSKLPGPSFKGQLLKHCRRSTESLGKVSTFQHPLQLNLILNLQDAVAMPLDNKVHFSFKNQHYLMFKISSLILFTNGIAASFPPFWSMSSLTEYPLLIISQGPMNPEAAPLILFINLSSDLTLLKHLLT